MNYVTPIREQYINIKKSYEDSILFFRMGDFYECFDDDAKIISEELDIALTRKSLGKNVVVPLAGIPVHACDTYLSRLVKIGYKVAICEQLSAATKNKDLVERGVVRVVTPGTVFEDDFLDVQSNNYLVSLFKDDSAIGLSTVDISTGEFFVTKLSLDQCKMELARLNPSEILISGSMKSDISKITDVSDIDLLQSGPSRHNFITILDDSYYSLDFNGVLIKNLELTGEDLKNISLSDVVVQSSGALLSYLQETQQSTKNHLLKPKFYSIDKYMNLDVQTRLNLELFDTAKLSGSSKTLFSTLNRTKTPMGARLLKKWIGQPLLEKKEIILRQNGIESLTDDLFALTKVEELLNKVSDIERISGKIKYHKATPNDLLSLKNTLSTAIDLSEIIQQLPDQSLLEICKQIQVNEEIINIVTFGIDENVEGKVGEGRTILPGYSQELDSLRTLANETKTFISELELIERNRTEIKNLKIGFNQVFGYFIEVSRANLTAVPDDYIRKQTLTNAERFITAQLKDYELEILTSRERIELLENDLYRQICFQISENHDQLIQLSQSLSVIDVICSFARIGLDNSYIRPDINDERRIIIKNGRHPVVEEVIGLVNYVPNDVYMSNGDANVIVLTGPNMAGKSTYIRQTAIIVLMAHIGSFVPATTADICLVDRIFTRIGLQDDLTTGQSTFMVEMLETASILNHATSKSLLILDEIGRGTSTYDGLSIAQSVIEYIHNNPSLGCKTLFATHYHELSELSSHLPRVKNYHVAVSEENGDIIFLRRIISGSSDKSYGIHVAKLAGMPKSILLRASDLLYEFEENNLYVDNHTKNGLSNNQLQLSWDFNGISEKLSDLDMNNMTPMEAMNILHKLKTDINEQHKEGR